MNFEIIYGLGGVIGFTPRQVDELTAWEFMAAFEGWKDANCPPEAPSAPTPEEHDVMVARFG